MQAHPFYSKALGGVVVQDALFDVAVVDRDARSIRRRDTRRSLDAAAAQAWLDQIEEYRHEALARVQQCSDALDFNRLMVAISWADLTECSESELSCTHCSLEANLARYERTEARWAQVARGRTPGYDRLGSVDRHAYDYVPPERYEEDYGPRIGPDGVIRTEKVRVLVDDDERLPEFQPIDLGGLPQQWRTQVVDLVSKMYNWVWEFDGTSRAVPTHEYVGQPFRFPTIIDDGKSAPHAAWEMRNVRFKRLASVEPKPKRQYPGTHYVGSEKNPPRIVVTTVWLEKRETYGVYVCWDAGRQGGRFTVWEPFEWYMVERNPANPAEGLDPEFWLLERALEVAYLKAKALRSEWGAESHGHDAVPFSPEKVMRIADAQAAESERRRTTTDPDEG